MTLSPVLYTFVLPERSLRLTTRWEFKSYLKEAHPNWNENTISVQYSDAFFAYNNNIGIDFWSCFIYETSMKKARDRIKDFLKIEKESDRAEERADGYFSSMRYFKAFLDEWPSNIPKESFPLKKD